MNKTTKKLFVSSLALAFAAATTISTSYAWFTMQTTAKVTQLDVKVTTGTGFEIKFGGNTVYKQTLTSADFASAYPNLLTSLNLNHVTSNDGFTDFRKLDVDTNALNPAAVNSDYLEFEIDFRGRAAYRIYLKDILNGSYLWSNGSSFKINSSVLVGEEGALRYTTDATVTNLKEYLGSAEMIGEIDPNRYKSIGLELGDSIVAFAADAARVSIDDTATTSKVSTKVIDFSQESTTKGYGTEKYSAEEPIVTNLAFEYYNSIIATPLQYPEDPDPIDESHPKITPATPVTLASLADKGNGDNIVILKAPAIPDDSYYGQIKVRVWLEGWDADCFNAIFNDILHIGLSFDGELDTTLPTMDYTPITTATAGTVSLNVATATDDKSPVDAIEINYAVKNNLDEAVDVTINPEGGIPQFDGSVTGTYDVTVTATDEVGNVQTVTHQITVS